jgi:GrpB-like predicted nucleotidyltransferase (UPF0157 family)
MNATLGLLYGKVELVPYTSEWALLFVQEAARLREVLSPWPCQIEHVGSTAVPGLVAKPILDIAIGVPVAVTVNRVIAAIESLGYEYRGDAGASGGHILVRESRPRVRTHHLHVVALGDDQWTAYLALRDLLRANPDARDAYVRAKRALASVHDSDRTAYSAGKAEVIRELLSQVR